MNPTDYSILLVDDEQDIRESLKDILEDEGHNIFLAENAKMTLLATIPSRHDLLSEQVK